MMGGLVGGQRGQGVVEAGEGGMGGRFGMADEASGGTGCGGRQRKLWGAPWTENGAGALWSLCTHLSPPGLSFPDPVGLPLPLRTIPYSQIVSVFLLSSQHPLARAQVVHRHPVFISVGLPITSRVSNPHQAALCAS